MLTSDLMRTDDLLLRQTRIHFPRFGAEQVKITPIEKGGSDRKFYRLKCSPDHSLILVKYNLEREENRHYVRIAEFLSAHDIRAPKIYYHDAAEGLIWIEDLGEEDLFSHRHDSWLVRRAYYEDALDEVGKLHRLPEAACVQLKNSLPAEFNAALYRWEQGYFLENCLGRYYQVDPGKIAMLAKLDALGAIAESLDHLPRTLVHRDFQSQNIIVRNGRACLIDFQGMRPGLPQYDIASLLWDPYVDLNDGEREQLFGYYCGGSVSDNFRRTLRLCAMQRLMQALGAYGFLGLVKGHRHFLSHIPAAIISLDEIVAQIDGLEPLRDEIADIRTKRRKFL
jgi:aminoglycoside/choline kinase family phosphotransferase